MATENIELNESVFDLIASEIVAFALIIANYKAKRPATHSTK